MKSAPPETELMDRFFAVFNLHVNDAGKRALNIVRVMLPVSEMPALMRLEDEYKSGVMAIFDRPPDEATRAFTALVFTFVNGLDRK